MPYSARNTGQERGSLEDEHSFTPQHENVPPTHIRSIHYHKVSVNNN
jgi:hypothetical protein